MAGWVKLHRDITDNFLWSGEPFSKGQAWVDLILHANFTDNKIQIKGQVVNLKRGQQARSVLTLVKDWKWSKGKVLRFLETLKNERMIEVEAGHLTSVITICNYEVFQAGDTPDGTPNSTPDGTAGGTHAVQQAVHSKEGNKEKNVKKVNKYTADDLKAAEWIYSKLLIVNPEHKRPNMDSWANTIRLMRERDSRTHEDICKVFAWANSDSFWSANILSPSKLREKFDQLLIKVNQPIVIQQARPRFADGDGQLPNLTQGNDLIEHEQGYITYER